VGRVYRDVEGYTRQPWRDGLREAVASQLDAVPVDDMRPGDVLLMRYRAEPQHLAIVTDYPGALGIIHARSDVRSGNERGRVVEHRLAGLWPKRIVGVFR
jgi:hypothetical protein